MDELFPQALFEQLQADWRAAREKANEMCQKLKYKYGSPWMAPARKEAEFVKAREVEEACAEAIFAWLDTHSPRQWRSGCPAYWICDSLSYADAITAGPMSVVPPVAFGYEPRDAQRFAQAVA